MRQTDTRLLIEKARPSTLPKKVIYILVRSRTSPRIVRWAFLLFVFTIPFEYIDLEALRGGSSISRMAGFLFFSTCLFYPKVCFRRPPQALCWFAGYVAIYGLSGLFLPEKFISEFIVGLQTLIQLLVLCWLGSTLLQEEKFTRHTVLTLAIATLLAAAGMLLKLPGFSSGMAYGGVRLSIGNFDPNGLALIMALAAQALIGLGIDQTPRSIGMRVIFMAMSLLPLAAMVYTGSRGGMAAFLIGVALYALPYRRSKRKMIAILGVAIAVGGVIYTVATNPVVLSRVELSYDQGDTAGRDKIFAASVEMFSEKPLLGWQSPMLTYELGSRLGLKQRSPHNLFLHLLPEVGIIGTIPFLIGLGLCVRTAWRARVHTLGLLPLVWLVTMIVGNMAIIWLARKALWLVLALSLASGALIVKQYKRKI